MDHHVCSGTTLLILSFCQCFSIAWVYGQFSPARHPLTPEGLPTAELWAGHLKHCSPAPISFIHPSIQLDCLSGCLQLLELLTVFHLVSHSGFHSKRNSKLVNVLEVLLLLLSTAMPGRNMYITHNVVTYHSMGFQFYSIVFLQWHSKISTVSRWNNPPPPKNKSIMTVESKMSHFTFRNVH